MTQSNQPVFEAEFGAIKATVGRNRKEQRDFYNIDTYRLYKDQDNHWKRTSSFGSQDLSKVGKTADEAYQHTYKLRAEGNGFGRMES